MFFGSVGDVEKRLLEELLSRRLVVNIGKGGVGKSSLTASLARFASRQGKRVLICEVNAKERMPSLLRGQKPSSLDTLDQIWQVDERIWAVNILPSESLKEYIVQVLHLGLLYNVVFENRFIKSFLRAIPGLQELVFVGKVWYHVTEELPNGQPRFDLVLVDSPSTGHGLAMLRTPSVVVDTVPVGPMHAAAQRILKMLQDRELTQINLLTLPEEMPVNETGELYEQLKSGLRLPLGLMFVNQWPKAVVSPEHEELFVDMVERGRADAQAAPLFAVAQAQRTRVRKAQEQLAHLMDHVHLPLLKLPRFGHQLRDAALVDKMEEVLSALYAQGEDAED